MESVANKLHRAAPREFVEIGYRFTCHSTDFCAQIAIQMLNMLSGLYGLYQIGGVTTHSCSVILVPGPGFTPKAFALDGSWNPPLIKKRQ